MSKTFVLDASALIAFLADEPGAAKVDDVFHKARKGACALYMNKINVLEIYYGVYRADGVKKAEETLDRVAKLPFRVVDTLVDDVFKEAGRLKGSYKISLADSIALAEANIRNAELITTDYHEFDPLDKKGEGRFHWIR